MVADTNPSWEWNPAHAGSLAQALAAYWTTPVIVTRGEHGAVVASPEGSGDQSHVVGIEGLRIDGPTDTVGAGDSFVAGVAVSVAAGISWPDAARFATVVAGVTVRKLFMTGTASPEEVRDAAANVELNYAPERLYPDAASAGTRGAPVEIITPVTRRQFRVAVFDHDGTISTLREGWEAVMRRHMLTAIVGEPARCEPARQREVMAEIDAYIERTTGVQTIIQMHGLVEMVHRYGYVGPEEIQSPAEYKAAYAAELRSGVHARLAALEAGTRTVEDFTVRGAVEFLSILRDRGLTLYLASGTDQDDTRAEAQALGYAGLFQEIRGSVDDTQKDPKRLLLEQILSNLSGPHAGAVVVFGDGPVEMREGRVHGAATVGVLSDEVRRYGWNHAKRCRQVSGGAQLLIPDFTDPDAILGHLFLEGS